VFGAVFCFRSKELGEAAARRHIAYDAIWFYQLSFFVGGGFFVVVGIGMLIEWASAFIQ